MKLVSPVVIELAANSTSFLTTEDTESTEEAQGLSAGTELAQALG